MTSHFTLHAIRQPSPNPLKPAILLQKLKMAYEIHELNLGDDPVRGVKGSDFLAINPNGRAPALIDHHNNDFAVWESGAILHYLCDKYDGDGRFIGKTADERAVVLQWLAFQLSGQGPTQGQVNYAHHFWQKTYDEKPCQSVFTRYEGELVRLYKVLEAQLKQQKRNHASQWIALDRATIADFAFFPWLHTASFSKLDLTAFPHVNAWYEALKADRDVQAAVARLS